jgi:hypothetical protein
MKKLTDVKHTNNINGARELGKVIRAMVPAFATVSVKTIKGSSASFFPYEVKIKGISMKNASDLEGLYTVDGVARCLEGVGVHLGVFSFGLYNFAKLQESFYYTGVGTFQRHYSSEQARIKTEAEAQATVVDSVQFVDSFPAMASEHVLSHFAEGFGDSFKVVENGNGITVDIFGAPSKMNTEGTTEEARQAVRHSFEMSAGYADFIHDGQLYESKKDKDGEPVPVEFYAGDWDVAQFRLVLVNLEEEQTPTETPETAPEAPEASPVQEAHQDDVAPVIASVSTVGIVKQAKQITQATPATPVNVLKPHLTTIVNKKDIIKNIVEKSAYDIKEGQAGEPADLTKLDEAEMIQMKTQKTAVKYENLKEELLKRLGKSKGKLSVRIKKFDYKETEATIILTGATLAQASRLEGFMSLGNHGRIIEGCEESNGVFSFCVKPWDKVAEAKGGRLSNQLKAQKQAKKEAKLQAVETAPEVQEVEIVEAVTPVEVVEEVVNVVEVAEIVEEVAPKLQLVKTQSKGLKKLKKMEQKAPKNITTPEEFASVLASILPKGAKVNADNLEGVTITGTTLGWVSYLEGIYTINGTEVHLVGSSFANCFKLTAFTSEELPESVKNFGYPLTNEQAEQKKNKKNSKKVA